VDKGYIYVAQPPLYRVSKGKEEHYIGTEEELTRFFVDRAVASTPSRSPPQEDLQGRGAAKLLDVLQRYERLLARLGRRDTPRRSSSTSSARGSVAPSSQIPARPKTWPIRCAPWLRGFALALRREHNLYDFTAKSEENPHAPS